MRTWIWIFLFLFLLISSVGCTEPTYRALLVGVGKYSSAEITDLLGPPNDVSTMKKILLEGSYGLEVADLVTLTDDSATLERFREEMGKLIEASKKEDVVLIYFSGHGSQRPDGNGDEADGTDETLLFHDARTNEGGELVDDELNTLVNAIPAGHVLLILDSCFSGGGFREEGVKAVEAAPGSQPLDGGFADQPDLASSRIICLTATSKESKPAREEGTNSLFTMALSHALTQVGTAPLSYVQLIDKVNEISESSDQRAMAQGAVHRIVLDATSRVKPVSWTVTRARGGIRGKGPLLPGWTKGAIVGVYPAEAKPETMRDRAACRGRLRLTKRRTASAGFTIEGTSFTVTEGDLLVLFQPGGDTDRLRVQLSEDGFTPERRAELIKSIAEDPLVSEWLEMTEDGADFEVRPAGSNKVAISGNQGRAQCIETDDSLGWRLYVYALQRDFFSMSGRGGSLFEDNQSLELLVMPSSDQPKCVAGPYRGKGALPVCLKFELGIRYRSGEKPLRVGGLLLTSNGTIIGFPFTGENPELAPGETLRVPGELRATPPVGVEDTIMVVGVTGDLDFNWSSIRLTRRPSTRDLEDSLGLLFHQPGTRGGFLQGKVSAYTISRMTLRLEAPQSKQVVQCTCN